MGSSCSCQNSNKVLEPSISPLDPNLIMISRYNKHGELREYHVKFKDKTKLNKVKR